VKWYWKWVNRLGLAERPRVRKLIVGVIGGTVVLFGLVLVILPGPAVLVVPLGLALLATEFAWARRLIRRGGVFWGRARRWHWRRKGAAAEGSLGNDAK
jgi:Putative transmembrane protein (PGPGW)